MAYLIADDAAGWRAFFSRFDDIVLVANSDAVDVAALAAGMGENTLFVFFNKVYKVLDRPFARPAILVARSSEAGANIVYRREVEDVVRLLQSPGFLGILNLTAASHERFSPAAEFGERPVGFLDLTGHLAGFYPADHLPSSGFALAVWMAEADIPGRIQLAGFTARRSKRWKVFHIHDWTFEQVVQRLLVRKGRLRVAGEGMSSPSIAAIADRFPEIEPGDVALVAAQVLSDRLEGANVAIDRLMSLTKLQRRLDDFLRSLKPRTRKQKLAEKTARDSSGG